jgi:hypothetical protein
MTAPPLAPTVLAQIASLADLPWVDLKGLWVRLFGSEPAISHRRYLERRIAHRLQERALNEDPAGKALLKRNRERIEVLIKVHSHGAAEVLTRPGTELVRVFRGTEYVVRVLDQGVEWNGQHYTSLTAVAQAITGMRWSGPVFFGLKTNPRKRAGA